jgi:hypothetical protein
MMGYYLKMTTFFPIPAEGIFRVLSDPSGDLKWNKELVTSTESTTFGYKDGGTATDTPSETPAAEIRGKAEVPGTSGCSDPKTVDKGTLTDTPSTAEDSNEGKEMNTDLP